MSKASAKFPSLQNAPINLTALRDVGKKKLNELLSAHEGPKTCVLDPNLTRPLNLVTEGVQVFKSNHVKEFKELSWEPLNVAQPTVIFIVRPEITLMKQIAYQIHSESEKNDRDYAIYFVPRRTFICGQVLKDEGVFSAVHLGEYQVDLIPFEDDILSLELHNSFCDCYLNSDTTSLLYIARSLVKLQNLYGLIPHLKSKGKLSSTVLNMVLRMREERLTSGGKDFSNHSAIDTCVILDRSVDYVSALVTPLTYEALIDEILGIENGVLYIDLSDKRKGKRKGASNVAQAKSYVRLNNNSSLYSEVRDVNISSLGPILQGKTREIRGLYNSRPNASNSVEDLKEFVKKIPALKESYASLEAHTQIADQIIKTTSSVPFRKRWQVERDVLEGGNAQPFLEDAIARQEPLADVLRLMCLQSLTAGGLKNSDYLRTELLQTYGYEVLLTLHRLEKLQLLTKRASLYRWPTVRSKFKLIVDPVKTDVPDDIAYVTSGYAPLSVRVVQMALQNQWKRNAELLRLLPGPQLEHTQKGVAPRPPTREADQAKKTMLVYMIGGITFMEIAALRWLSRRKGSKYNIIVATTKLVSSSKFMQSLVEGLDSGLRATGHKP